MSTSMFFGSGPAFQSKLAESKRELEEGYGHALAAEQQHTIRLLPPPLPGSHAPSTTTKSTKKDNILKAVRPRQRQKKPTAQRAQRLQRLGCKVNLSLPLRHYPDQPPKAAPAATLQNQEQAAHPPAALVQTSSLAPAITKAATPTQQQAEATATIGRNDNPAPAITNLTEDTANVARPKTFRIVVIKKRQASAAASH